MLDRPSRRVVLRAATSCLAAPFVASMPVRAQQLSFDGVRETADALDQLHALVVHRGGEPLFEEAFRGAGLDSIANVKSVSKTLVALLTGIAIEREDISGPDQRVLPLLNRDTFGDARDALTVGDFLSMRTGLESTSGGSYGAWIASDDWVGYALSRDLVGQPGGRFIYSTGGWHVLGAALAEAAGQDLLTLFRERLAEPLGIELPAWDRDPQGHYMGGNQMGLTPRGLARIGDMVVAEGRWDGGQVVPADWLQTSWQPRARSPWSGDRYGYGWFLTDLAGHAAAYGRGYGGQVLAVVPDLELTIAITSDPTRPARSGGYFGDLVALMEAAVEVAERA